MAAFFTRERFGRPQVYAGLLLLLFAALCLWVIVRAPLQQSERAQIQRGLAQWTHFDVRSGEESPLIALIASAGMAVLPVGDQPFIGLLPALLARLPFLFLALLRGASLWYVTHRLYGNAGGYIALALYCLSFPIILASALVNPHGPAAWGFFGAIFSGIALSHTVYALGETPREQLAGFRHWRWRRIGLLGVAFGVAIGSHSFAAIAVFLTLAFMLYLAPGRRTACVGIVLVACAIGVAIVLGAYFFQVNAFVAGLVAGFRPGPPTPHWGRFEAFAWPASPALFVLLAICAVTYLLWKRARYFGNSAPLLVLGLLWLISPLAPEVDAARQIVLSFAFIFIAGIMADLLETKRRQLVLGALLVLFAGHAATTLWYLRMAA